MYRATSLILSFDTTELRPSEHKTKRSPIERGTRKTSAPTSLPECPPRARVMTFLRPQLFPSATPASMSSWTSEWSFVTWMNAIPDR